MRRSRRALGATLVLAGVVAGLGARGSAAELVETAWWWRVQSKDIVLPAPPGTDADDLVVQGAPDGAIAIAALRISLDATEVDPVLTVHLQSSQGATDAVVVACPTNSFWHAGGNQAWDDRPIPAATCPAKGVIGADGTTMTFDLSEFPAGPELQVILAPGRVEGRPAGADGSVFSLTLDAPNATDLTTSAAPPPSPSPTPPTSAPTDSGVPAGGVVSLPAFRPSPGLVPAAPAPAAPAAPAAPVAAPAESIGAIPTIPLGSDGGNTARWLGVLLVAAVALGAVTLSRRESVLALVPGRAIDPEALTIGGIGRFAQPREGTPPSLL